MEVELRVQNTSVVRDLRSYADQRFHFVLRRFAHRIQRLKIHVTDVNGPRGGIDKHCRILAEVAPSGTLVIEETGAQIHLAMDRAANRLRNCVRRELKRRVSRRMGKTNADSIRFPDGRRFVRTEV